MNSLSSIWIFVAACVSILPLIGSMFPYGFPLFSPVCAIFSFLIIIKRKQIRFGQWTFVYSILALSYFIPLALSTNIYKANYSDITNIFMFFIFFIALFNLIVSRENLKYYTHCFQVLIALFSTGFAIIGLYKFKLLLSGVKIPLFFRGNSKYPWGTSLVGDYNVYGMALLFGLVSIYFLFKRSKKLRGKYALIVSGMIIIFAAAFSGSRRTWIVLSIILIFFAISFLKYSLFGILIFRIKKRQLINIMAVVLVILSIIGIYKYIGFDSQYYQQHYLNRMGKRFVGIRDVFEKEGGAEARIKRYTFAGELFEEYNTLGLLIGKGSEYMRQYGFKFNAGDGFGYPHNLIISAFLQSGILGGLTVISYLMLSLFLYIKRVKKPIVGYLFALFMITTFYTMTSGNTIFSKKIYIFLLLLPWLIDKIYSKKQLVQNKMVQYNLKPS